MHPYRTPSPQPGAGLTRTQVLVIVAATAGLFAVAEYMRRDADPAASWAPPPPATNAR